ncbi:hypothetical protein AOX55_00001917 [Sinorhizobium fredii CCBAU 25509]|nr:hypothetical protein SF83666_c16120 [Sinorhizobium fredii CCBAU 83666]AWM25171.1 hypothetical protein AOX55_00001917 [Sinorhizobium fredii CCBAU 25509]
MLGGIGSRCLLEFIPRSLNTVFPLSAFPFCSDRAQMSTVCTGKAALALGLFLGVAVPYLKAMR